MEIITHKQLTNGFRTRTLPQLQQHKHSVIAAVTGSAIVAHSSWISQARGYLPQVKQRS